MNFLYMPAALAAVVLLTAAGPALASSGQGDVQPQAASAAKPGKAGASGAAVKAPAKVKLVDINSATSKELSKLPGVTDAVAAKIIAGRPYGSKAQLVTHHVIDEGAYENIRKLIIAAQPYADAASNAALYDKKR
jgi:DNA uptake protein ComE-like DNA-binding protein